MSVNECAVNTIPQNKSAVAFVCVHNSCRSQIAEALGRHLAGDLFDFYSAGTEVAPQINQDAVRLMKQEYGIDMEATQRPKTIDELPRVKAVISMGCDVACPMVQCDYRDDWGLEDPTGKEDSVFIDLMAQIHSKIIELRDISASIV